MSTRPVEPDRLAGAATEGGGWASPAATTDELRAEITRLRDTLAILTRHGIAGEDPGDPFRNHEFQVAYDGDGRTMPHCAIYRCSCGLEFADWYQVDVDQTGRPDDADMALAWAKHLHDDVWKTAEIEAEAAAEAAAKTVKPLVSDATIEAVRRQTEDYNRRGGNDGLYPVHHWDSPWVPGTGRACWQSVNDGGYHLLYKSFEFREILADEHKKQDACEDCRSLFEGSPAGGGFE